MTSKTSRFHIAEGSIVKDPIPALPFIPGSGNVFPKYPEVIPQTAWELWYFDGISKEDHAAIVIGVTRNAEGQKHGGFKLQVFGIWPDETTWHRDFFFPESVVTEAGHFSGVWEDSANDSRISFDVAADCSKAALKFAVPSLVNGSMILEALPGDTGLESKPELGHSVYYVRPIGRAQVTAEMLFQFPDSQEPRKLVLNSARGGMDRVWSPLAWPQIMTESYYLRAQVGPYAMQLMRIFSEVASGNKPHTVARLYHEGKLVCAAQQVIEHGQEVSEDSIILSKITGSSDDPGITGAFRDKNHGYVLEFIQAGNAGRKWRFKVVHERTIWNMPTSAPGPNGTGNTGFVELVIGGLDGEVYQGVGTGGQCELS